MSSSKTRTDILNGVEKHHYAALDDVFPTPELLSRKATLIHDEVLSLRPLTVFSESPQNVSSNTQPSSISKKKGQKEKTQSPAADSRLIFPAIVQICDKKTEMRAMKVGITIFRPFFFSILHPY